MENRAGRDRSAVPAAGWLGQLVGKVAMGGGVTQKHKTQDEYHKNTAVTVAVFVKKGNRMGRGATIGIASKHKTHNTKTKITKTQLLPSRFL